MDDLRAGRMIVLVDDEYRENEGDLVCAAEHATPDAINFMIREGRGLVCLAMTHQMCDRLDLHPQVHRNTALLGTAFTVSVDARDGITTGISAFDRARSIAVSIDERSRPDDLVRPGHLFPLRAEPGGVLVRAGQTEGSVDLMRLAGMKPAGVICEIIRDDGQMARVPDLVDFCVKHRLKMLTIEELIKYRRSKEILVRREIEVRLPNPHSEDCHLIAYSSAVDPEPHLAITFGGVGLAQSGVVAVQEDPILVRVHSECLTGDVFDSLLCDCGPQLHHALAQLAGEKKGVLLYMRQEGRGIGLLNKLKAYKLQQEENLDTLEANRKLGFAADLRHYGIGAQILFDLGIRKIRLLTNNPKKVVGIDGYGLHIVERVAIEVPPNELNRHYLETKRTRFGHLHLDSAS
jgi:3,4-dihydroxy 2-butanone 4-phosphate synthase/GTP cyclohydrolase II